MTNLFRHTEDLLAEAAMAEEGAQLGTAGALACDPYSEMFEENLMEVAFDEAADYDAIHRDIRQEHLSHCATA